MPDVLADGVEHGTATREVVSVAAHHDGQRAGLRAPDPAADGRIQVAAALAGRRVADALRGVRPIGAEVDPELALAGAFDDAVVAEKDFVADRRNGQAGADDVHVGGYLGGSAGGLAAGGDEVVDLAAAAVVHDHVKSGVSQIAGHRQAHRPQPDESDFHVVCLVVFVRAPACHSRPEIARAVRAWDGR